MPTLSYKYEMCTILQSNAQTSLLFESLDSFGPDKCHKEFYNGEFSELTDNVYLFNARVSAYQQRCSHPKKCKIISYLNHTLVLHVHVGGGLSCFEGGP